MTSRAESNSSANAIVVLLDRNTTISFYSESHAVYADLLIRKFLHVYTSCSRQRVSKV